MPEISVYGLTHEEIRELTQLAKQRYGKASVSWMAKRLLKAQLEKEEPELIGLPPLKAANVLPSACLKKTVPTSKPPPKSTKAA